MDFKGIRVLVADGENKQTLAMIRGLKEIGCHVTVLCENKWDACNASNLPDVKIINTRLSEWSADCYTEEEKKEYYISLLSSGKYDVLMPMIDVTTDFVTRNEVDFGRYVKLACSPRNVFINAYNKQITFDKALESGIPCPNTRHSRHDIEEFLKSATFPVIIKPRQGRGSIGFHKFNSEAEFREMLADCSFNVDDYVVQEYVEFEHRIGINVFVNQHGDLSTAYAVDVTRWFPLDAGSAVMIQSVDAPDLIQYTARLLKELNWKGFADLCFMIEKNTGKPRLLEINGRIPASVKMCFVLGCNISRQFLEMIYDQEVIKYPVNSKFGVYLRHLDTDFAWFLKSPDRFRATPSWFSWKNTYEVVYSKDDKKPFFYRFFQQLTRYKKIMANKKH